jgi:hypothetical protein
MIEVMIEIGIDNFRTAHPSKQLYPLEIVERTTPMPPSILKSSTGIGVFASGH